MTDAHQPSKQTRKILPPGGTYFPLRTRTGPRNPGNKKPSVPTAKHLSSTNSKLVTSSRRTKTSAGQAGSPSMPPPDKHRGPRTRTVDLELAANLVTYKLNSNYWSPCACLVKEQEEPISEFHTNIEKAMSAIITGRPPNKVAVHWVQKLHNRKLRRFAFLDLGATSGAAPAEDKPDLINTGQSSRKTFMFLDGRT